MFAEQAKAKGLHLTSEMHGSVPAKALVDGIRLRQVLTNLITNAVKFTQVGEVRISVKPGVTLGAGRMEIQFSVSDTGMGIEPDTGNTIFEPFRQGHKGAAVPSGGTGLGLSICRMLVEMMGGTLRYESILSQGTTFYFTIDAECLRSPGVPGAADAAYGDEDAAKPRGLAGMSVLVGRGQSR